MQSVNMQKIRHKKLIVPNCEEENIPSQPESDQQEETEENINDNCTKAEILQSLLYAEHDLPFLVNDHSSNIFKMMFNDSATAGGYKCGRTKTMHGCDEMKY